MSKQDILNCNITKDLLPSYLENICTKDTKHAVDMHLAVCKECRNLADVMSKTDFQSERTEIEEIDYMKKMKRHFLKKSIYGIFLSIFVLAVFLRFISNYNLYPMQVYYFFLPFLLVAAKIFLHSAPPTSKNRKFWNILTFLAVLLTCFSICIHIFVYTHLENFSSQIFKWLHLKPENLGIFLHWQFIILIIFLYILFLIGIYQTIYGKSSSFVQMNIYLTCAFIVLGQDLNCHSISDVSSALYNLLQSTFLFLIEGIAVTLLSALIDRIKRRHS